MRRMNLAIKLLSDLILDMLAREGLRGRELGVGYFRLVDTIRSDVGVEDRPFTKTPVPKVIRLKSGSGEVRLLLLNHGPKILLGGLGDAKVTPGEAMTAEAIQDWWDHTRTLVADDTRLFRALAELLASGGVEDFDVVPRGRPSKN